MLKLGISWISLTLTLADILRKSLPPLISLFIEAKTFE